jgi:glycerol kinase
VRRRIAFLFAPVMLMADARPEFLLALDQGSHASKALVFDGRGVLLGQGEVAIATQEPRPGWVEHDAEELVGSVLESIEAALTDSGLDGSGRWRAGLATQRSSIVCWDRDTGRALSPILSWRDRRNAAWLGALALEPTRLRAVTGLVASPHYGASKLRWCLDDLPEVRRAAEDGRLNFGPLASFLLARLLVERPCLADPANAARTLLWDLGTGDWSEELLARFRIRREWLPACVPSRHPFGTLQLGGLKARLEVCTGDQPAALFAWGEPDPAALFVNIGTGAFVQQVFRGAVPAAEGLLEGIAWRAEAGSVRVLEGTVNGAGAALSWLSGERNVPVESLVAQAPAWLDEFDDPPLFRNGVGGLGSPFWNPDAPIGFDRAAGLAAETVAVLESIAFLLQVNIEAIRAAAREAASRIVISGGLARLDGLCQRLADLSGLAVERPPEFEATACGLAWLLGGVAAGRQESTRFEPGPAEDIEARFRRWRALMG